MTQLMLVATRCLLCALLLAVTALNGAAALGRGMEAPLRRRAALTTLLVLVATALAVAAPAQADRRAPSPGSAGIGDRLFPTLGNGGYDVLNYQLNLRYATSDPSQPVHGDVVILARATQSLSRFNLDFGGESVGSVSVNHRQAAWTRDGEELVITPQEALPDHRKFVVVVSDFVAVPPSPTRRTSRRRRSSSRPTAPPRRRSRTSRT